MYSERPNLMIGFHGCDELTRNNLVSNPNKIKISEEVNDWLGHGFYIWENNYERAIQWAKDKAKRNDQFKNPSVVGVVYQLRNCLDFTDSEYINLISTYYELFKQDCFRIGKELPKNKDSKFDKYHDLVRRELDCAVIEYMNQQIYEEIENDVMSNGFSKLEHFDTVRGIFTEGGPAFEGAGIQRKNHIQICIRNLNCIKGFFIPRNKTFYR